MVAWTAVDGGTCRVQLRRWTGDAWEELGASASAAGLSVPGRGFLDLVLFKRAMPDGMGVFVRRWNGRAWVDVTRVPASGASVRVAAGNITVDRDGRPVVAWHSENRKIQVARLSRAP